MRCPGWPASCDMAAAVQRISMAEGLVVGRMSLSPFADGLEVDQEEMRIRCLVLEWRVQYGPVVDREAGDILLPPVDGDEKAEVQAEVDRIDLT